MLDQKDAGVFQRGSFYGLINRIPNLLIESRLKRSDWEDCRDGRTRVWGDYSR